MSGSTVKCTMCGSLTVPCECGYPQLAYDIKEMIHNKDQLIRQKAIEDTKKVCIKIVETSVPNVVLGDLTLTIDVAPVVKAIQNVEVE